MAVVRADCVTITDWASLEAAMRGGRPNSLIAYSALHNGRSPPKAVAEATRRAGICQREK